MRTLLDNARKVVPKAQRDKQFSHHEHRSEQQVSGVIDQRGLPTFEQPVPDDLRCDSDDNEYRRKRPHGERGHLADDQGRRRKQCDRRSEDPCAKRNIEQETNKT